MIEKQYNDLIELFRKHPEVKLAYFFGSRARGEGGPTSDYDIAVYLDEGNKKRLSDIHRTLCAEIARCLGTDAADVVLLNTTNQPELAYAIITEGRLFYEQEPYRLIVEPRILNEYFDFYAILKQYELTHA